jgi:uncharacterized protein with GYD domain
MVVTPGVAQANPGGDPRKENAMSTYFVCFNYTDQGIRTIGGSTTRLPDLKRRIQAMGGELIGFYLTMGMFDTVAIITAPDDKALTRLVLSVAAAGNVKTTTMKAFTESEFLEIVSGLPGS